MIDAIDNIDVFLVPMTSRDKPTKVQALYTAEAAFNNCTKHFEHGEDLLNTTSNAKFLRQSDISS